MRWLPLLFTVVSLFSSCNKDEVMPSDLAKDTLKKALVLLHNHNFDEYMQYLDDVDDMDSVQLHYMHLLLAQHQDWQDQEKGAVAELNMSDAKMIGDTVCLVYYEIVFADSTREMSSQKMVMNADKNWRIKLRN